MTVIADSGPLIALAKIGGLGTLFDLYPNVVTPRAVYEEVVVEGSPGRPPDASLLLSEYDAGRLRVEELQEAPVAVPQKLGRGERASIQLAIQARAEWLLIDDFEARQVAIEALALRGTATRIKGTLGIITSAYLQGHASLDHALELLDEIRARRDIWISIDLCQQVADALQRAARRSSA